jgi:hypothetical protein
MFRQTQSVHPVFCAIITVRVVAIGRDKRRATVQIRDYRGHRTNMRGSSSRSGILRGVWFITSASYSSSGFMSIRGKRERARRGSGVVASEINAGLDDRVTFLAACVDKPCQDRVQGPGRWNCEVRPDRVLGVCPVQEMAHDASLRTRQSVERLGFCACERPPGPERYARTTPIASDPMRTALPSWRRVLLSLSPTTCSLRHRKLRVFFPCEGKTPKGEKSKKMDFLFSPRRASTMTCQFAPAITAPFPFRA